jgi:hypothetical protein
MPSERREDLFVTVTAIRFLNYKKGRTFPVIIQGYFMSTTYGLEIGGALNVSKMHRSYTYPAFQPYWAVRQAWPDLVRHSPRHLHGTRSKYHSTEKGIVAPFPPFPKEEWASLSPNL